MKKKLFALGLLFALLCSGCGGSVGSAAVFEETVQAGESYSLAELLPLEEVGAGYVCYYRDYVLWDNGHHWCSLVYVPTEAFDCVKITVRNDTPGEIRVLNHRAGTQLEEVLKIPAGGEGTIWLTDIQPEVIYDATVMTTSGETLAGAATITAGSFEALGYPGEKES